MSFCRTVHNDQQCADSGGDICQRALANGQFVAVIGKWDGEPDPTVGSLPSGQGVQIVYKNGDYCYLNPSQPAPRTAIVNLHCDRTQPKPTTFTIVEDNDTCTYTIEMRAAAACPAGTPHPTKPLTLPSEYSTVFVETPEEFTSFVAVSTKLKAFVRHSWIGVEAVGKPDSGVLILFSSGVQYSIGADGNCTVSGSPKWSEKLFELGDFWKRDTSIIGGSTLAIDRYSTAWSKPNFLLGDTAATSLVMADGLPISMQSSDSDGLHLVSMSPCSTRPRPPTPASLISLRLASGAYR
jgi:hypothetical protein